MCFFFLFFSFEIKTVEGTIKNNNKYLLNIFIVGKYVSIHAALVQL